MSLVSTILAITFIIRLHCGQNISIFNHIYRHYGEEGRGLFRKLESKSLKLRKCELDLEFLIKCKTYNIFSKFLRFKLYKRSLTSSSFFKSWHTKLLSYEINIKKKLISLFKVECDDIKCQIRNKVSFLDRILITRKLDETVDVLVRKTKSAHNKKLGDLGVNNDLAPVDPQKVVFNYSSRVITNKQKTLLAYVLDFDLPVYKINFFQYFLKLESLADRVRK